MQSWLLGGQSVEGVCLHNCGCMNVACGTGHMCDLSEHLAIWLPCVAGSEFGVGRQPAALISREPDARVSGYLNVKFLEFGCRAIWVDVLVSRCGAPSVSLWRIRVCQPKDTLAFVDL